MRNEKPRTRVVDRNAVIAWSQGIMLDRTPGGLTVGDGMGWVEEFMNDGGELLLTVDGEPVSRMRLSDDGTRYEERPL